MTEAEFKAHRAALIEYLRVKFDQPIPDWHGISDCANDLRVLEAQWDAIKPFRSLTVTLQGGGGGNATRSQK